MHFVKKQTGKKKGVTIMILDTAEHIGTYKALPGMEKIGEFLKTHDLKSMEVGTYEIDGKDLYVMIQNPKLKKEQDARCEAHVLYADLQLLIEGEEYMGYAPLETLGAPVEDPEGKDIAFYNGKFQKILVPEGSFAVFFPGDAHAPCIEVGNGGSVKKAVFKIRVA